MMEKSLEIEKGWTLQREDGDAGHRVEDTRAYVKKRIISPSTIAHKTVGKSSLK